MVGCQAKSLTYGAIFMLCIRGRKNNEPTTATGLLGHQIDREIPLTIATGVNLRFGLLIAGALPRMACSPRLPRRRRRDFVPRYPSRASSHSFFAARVRPPCGRVSR